MQPPETPHLRSSVTGKRRCKTPAPLGAIAARLFGNQAHDGGRSDRSNVSESSNGSVVYDQLYLDQCHAWFTRETRASQTPKPTPLFVSSIVTAGTSSEKKKPLRKKSIGSKAMIKRKRLTKRLNKQTGDHSIIQIPSQPIQTEDAPAVSTVSSETSSGVPEAMPSGCVGCSVLKNEEANSSNLFKLLANNVLICPMHRFITHWILDYFRAKNTGAGDNEFKAGWRPEHEEDQADSEFPFSVTEDRRLIAGVHRFGSDAWETIMSEFHFAPMRRPQHLHQRWQQLQHT